MSNVRIEKLETRLTLLNSRIEKDTADREVAAAELAGLKAIAAVGQGDIVTFVFGRQENRQELTGPVLGTQDDVARGKLLRVFAGEGFDAQTYTVQASQIVKVVNPNAPVEAVTVDAPAE
jgi:hypothetical protein